MNKLCLNPSNTVLASATSSIKLWDVSSKRVLKKFTGHSSTITHLKFDSQGRYLFSTSSSERSVYLWDADTTAITDTDTKDKYPPLQGISILFYLPSTGILCLQMNSFLPFFSLYYISISMASFHVR